MARSTVEPSGISESPPPPRLEESPDWFREQFLERQQLRREHDKAARARWDRRLRWTTLMGAIGAPLLSMISLFVDWSFASVALVVGGAAGYLVGRWELSPPGGAAVYGLITSSFCMASEVFGYVDGLILFHGLTWLTLICWGALISIVAEDDRMEVLPF